MKRARAYRRGNRLYFHAVSRTTTGQWVMAAPFVGVELGAAETFFGETLARVLDFSRFGARAPEDLALQRKPLLDLARTRTWRGFIRGTSCCDVERDAEAVRFFPARFANAKPLSPKSDPAITLPSGTLTIKLGAALLAAFRIVEPRRRVVSQIA